jgi:hypothetical protein
VFLALTGHPAEEEQNAEEAFTQEGEQAA